MALTIQIAVDVNFEVHWLVPVATTQSQSLRWSCRRMPGFCPIWRLVLGLRRKASVLNFLISSEQKVPVQVLANARPLRTMVTNGKSR